MIKIRIPGELPKGGALKVTIHIGNAGFKRSEFLREDEWRPGSFMYVDHDTKAVSFEVSSAPTKIIRRKLENLTLF